MTKEHEPFIQQCYSLAEEAVRSGDHPFGALLVLDGEVILSAVNTIHSDSDVTRHAEINLVGEAQERFYEEMLERSTLYSSTEPCAMCTGAIYSAGIPTIVYGCGAKALHDLLDSNVSIPSREILKLGQRETAVIGPVLEEEGLAIHRSYWF
jgi:tRNA(Arg) A34 adenosine deaminase TadA